MKKNIILFITVLLVSIIVGAQDLSKGKMFLEANTGSFATGNTSLYLVAVDNDISFSVGFDGGYFLSDKLALKAGLGFNNINDSFVYKAGVKYYLKNKFPLGADFTGADSDLWFGLQGGYAWFISDNVSIEPTVRYNISLEGVDGVFQGLVGFVIFI